MYKANNIDARMDPCGTPQSNDVEEEKVCPRLTENLLFVRNDLNHSNATPRMPHFQGAKLRLVYSIKS